MDIRILGAHNCESQNSRCVSLLIDEVLAVDAGNLTSSLSFPAQRRLGAILITHRHYDHIKDIPAIAMSLGLQQSAINVCSIPSVYEALSTHLLNGDIYPRFFERPAEKPTLSFTTIEPHKVEQVNGYKVLPVPLTHTVPTVGYQITSPDGKTVFYTGDTGSGLTECWRHISPQLLIIEVTASNKYEEFARKTGHLTPGLLKQELSAFRELKDYLPGVVTIHMNPYLKKEIEAEVAAISKELNAPVSLGYEGMELSL